MKFKGKKSEVEIIMGFKSVKFSSEICRYPVCHSCFLFSNEIHTNQHHSVLFTVSVGEESNFIFSIQTLD